MTNGASAKPDSAAIEQAVIQEIVRNERVRVTILVVMFSILAVFASLILFFIPRELYSTQESSLILQVTVFLGLMAVYAFSARFALGRALGTTIHVPVFVRYLSAVIETSMPTAVLVLMAQIIYPIYVLSLPPAIIYLVFIILSVLRLDFSLSIFTGFLAAIEYLLLSVIYTRQPGTTNVDPFLLSIPTYIGRAGVFMIAGVVAGIVTTQIKKYIVNSLTTLQERNRIIALFGQHVSPAVVDRLLSTNASTLTETRQVAVLFLDIRDFTHFSENRKPEDVVIYLNTLFDAMIEIINRHNGIINKFLGDGFMAVFGAPLSSGNDSQSAVHAALEILDSVEREYKAGKIPPTRVGMGIHAGLVLTGSVGSSMRQEYTIIGDTVNVASRIEQLNKQFSSQLLISESVWQSIDERIEGATPLGSVPVKGREAPIPIYRLV